MYQGWVTERQLWQILTVAVYVGVGRYANTFVGFEMKQAVCTDHHTRLSYSYCFFFLEILYSIRALLYGAFIILQTHIAISVSSSNNANIPLPLPTALLSPFSSPFLAQPTAYDLHGTIATESALLWQAIGVYLYLHRTT